MYFKRLEMHGFKSFAEPVLIDFHEGITCIVGPNGSGKSNISDAIRWVLGEQSPKMLRGGKMEEVIFAGTTNRKSRGMAEVTLVIDNSTGMLPIDYNEVAITRRMFRSGESEYLINNNNCRLRDIRELIMDTGIGVDGYSLIGQGKIADIVSNKTESRREIFEEAAGIVMYKSKKAEATRKLEATNGNLDRVEDIIGEIEGRIDNLKEDSIKAKEYLELKDQYRELEINITLKNIENITSKTKDIKEDIENLSIDVNKLLDEKKTIDDEITDGKAKNDNYEVLNNKAKDDLLVKVETISRLTNKNQLDKERLSTIEKDKTRLKFEIEELTNKLNLEEDNKSKYVLEKNQFSEKEKGSHEALLYKIDNYNDITDKSYDLADKIEENKNSLYTLHNQVSSKESEIKNIESYKETLEKRKSQLNTESDSKDVEVKEIKEELAKREKELETVLKDLEELKNEKSEKLKVREDLIAGKKQLSIRIDDLRIKGSQLSSRKNTIEEMENNYEGFSYAVKNIMKVGLEGIRGVVAELMTVPSGYEVAIETALGGAMQNIICDSDNSAKKAVRYLKESKSGRLTFLPLSSIKGYESRLESRVLNHPGFMGLASDSIEYDKAYENIYRYLLGKVIIVDNMDNAITLSKIVGNGMRIVTVDGEIINSSGSITGGKYKNNSANLLERKAEINKLEAEISALRREYGEKKEKHSSAEKVLLEIEKTLTDIEGKLREKELAELNGKNSVKMCNDNLSRFSDMENKAGTELASIKSDFDSADNMIKNLKKDIAEINKKITSVNHKIESDTEKNLKLKAIIEESNEEITNTRIAVREWESKRESIDNLLQRVNDSIRELKETLESKALEVRVLDEENSKLLFGSDDAEEAVVKLNEEKAQLEAYIQQVVVEKVELAESLAEKEKIQTQLGEKLNSLQDQKYQLEIRTAKNETQLDTFKEKMFEEFELSVAQALDYRIEDFVMSTAVRDSRDVKNRLRELGEVNVGAIREYESVKERYDFLTEQRDDINQAVSELRKIIFDMDDIIKTKFKENFDEVVVNFEKIFKELFGGGHAELCLENEDNPLETGIDIIAQPPGKKLQNLNLMSGGEKTMTAIALMFAVLKTKPTPFCILDEVEAALDDANIDRFANYLKNFKEIQFALVTHQKATMEHADVLYGVTMAEKGVSKVLSLRLGDDFTI